MSAVIAPVRSTGRLVFGGLLHAELIKLRSLRSTRAALAAVVLLTGSGMWADAANFAENAATGPVSGSIDAWRDVLSTGLLAGSLGVLVFAGIVGGTEYTTRSIVTTFVVAPGRLAVLAAKALVALAAVALAGALGSGLGIVAALPMMHAAHLSPPSSDVIGFFLSGVAQLVIIAAVLLPIGVLARSTAAALAFGFVVLFVLGLVIGRVSQLVGVQLVGVLLSPAADGVTSPLHAPGLTPGFWSALPAAVLWVVVPWIAAGFSTVRRDA